MTNRTQHCGVKAFLPRLMPAFSQGGGKGKKMNGYGKGNSQQRFVGNCPKRVLHFGQL